MNFKGLAVGALLLLPGTVSAGDTAAVLSSGGGAYLEAFSAFRDAFGGNMEYTDLSKGKPDLPPGIRTVVAFGGKAAHHPYPHASNIVYCLAPGVYVKAPPQGKAVKVSLIPDFAVTFAKLKQIQPGLKRLRIFWMLADFSRHTEAVKAEGKKQGIHITALRITSMEDIPAMLRQALGETDALWIPPDPVLVTAENLMILKEYSWANGIPFYGSTKGMAREGAAASIGISFREMGATAAAAAARMNSGESVPEIVFPVKLEIALNNSAAKRFGLEFPRAVMEEAAYVFP